MNRNIKLKCIFCCSFSNFYRYSLAVLMGVVLLSDSVGATLKNTELQIAQQPETNSQQSTRAAAQKAFEEGFAFFKEGSAESLRQARTKFEIALQLWQKVGDKGKQALTSLAIGRVYSDLGEKQKALEFYNQALPLYGAVGEKGGEARTLNNIGGVYSDLGEKQKALQYYNRALPLRRAVGERYGEAATLTGIGTVYDALGEKQKALEFYNQALPLFRAVGERYGEATTLNNIGVVYDALGEKQKALSFYNRALGLSRAVGDRRGEARTLNNIGEVYSDLGEKQKALSFYNRALGLRRAVGDRGGEAATLNNVGGVYSDLGEKQKALSFYNRALGLRRAVGDRGGEAATLNNVGGVYSDLGEKQKALSFYNQALELRRAVGDRGGEAGVLSNLAYLERDVGNLEQSLKQIEPAIKIIEDLRTKIDNQDLRTSYFASVQGYYKFYIDLLMQLHKKNPSKGYDALALHISERSRARGLIELLTEARADIRKGVDPKLLEEEQRLQVLINVKAKSLQELPGNKEEQAAALRKEIDNLLTQQKELQTKIRTSSPKYAALQYPQPLKLPQIQQQLDKDTLLLEYSLGEERSYLWVVSSNSVNSYELPARKQIEKAAKNFRDDLQQATAGNLAAKTATQLSQLILAPVADKLGQKRLVIVADGALQSIPFAALTQPGKSAASSNYQPLIVNHEIVNLPSASTIAFQRQELKGRKTAPKTLAILADPVFDTDDDRLTGKSKALAPELDLRSQLQQSALKQAARSFNRNGWNRLPGTGEEAKAILKLVSSSNHLQAFAFDANYNWATNKQLSQYRFLHFATHGFADPNSPELSGIVLSLVDKAGKPIEGYLRLGDIFNLDFTADLVVLSACETGLGKDVNGEGLVGLTRGLMYAGAERVAVSLWQVDDEGTSQLMQEFYKEMLQQGKSPTGALRAAQLKLLQDSKWNKPSYWAAFTLQGEWR
ncbi:CHAT domain-containing protein [Scytonema tolypothrichoides VB-61278]|nr:CHAT domain-containing protein [Scytonema tolypothrichoides VB-61278]